MVANTRRAQPEKLAERLSEAQADYSASKRSGRLRRRRKGIPPMGSGADWHYKNDSDFIWMGEVARDLDRNDVILGSVVDRVVDNTIQTGFKLNCDTGDTQLDTDLEQRFEEESQNAEACDVAEEMTFHEQEQMVLRDMIVAGDLFVLPVANDQFDSGQTQYHESHRCRSPHRTKKNIVHGIQMDDLRRRTAYYFTKEVISPLSSTAIRLRDLVRVAAKDDEGYPQVWHCKKTRRATQTRGVTSFAPIFDVASMHDDIEFAKLLQQQLASMFLLVRQRDMNFSPTPGLDPVGGTETYTEFGKIREGLEPGAELKGYPGEQILPWSANVPNAEFFPHVRLLLTLLGINLGMPLVMVLMDASETNFSGYRGAIEQARMGFRRNQRSLVSTFHRPAWVWRVRNWMESDPAIRRAALRSDIKLFCHSWDPPSWPYIQPLDDANADMVREANNLISPRRRCAERGYNWQTLINEIVDDRALGIRLAIVASLALNKEFGLEGADKVKWRDLYNPSAPQGVPLKRTEGEPSGAELTTTA